jgi:PPOX class probable FMN-dependent enzyme
MPLSYPFTDVIASEEQLRAVLGFPGERAVAKELDRLDRHARTFIQRSPFVLLSSASAAGRCDVSPKGDQPGFVKVLDERTLVIPDRPGNRRGDTLSNLLENPGIGMLFLVPEVEETLRVNGRGQIVRDDRVLDMLSVGEKRPVLAIAVEVEEVYFHCAKAFRRSGLWQPARWTGRGELPSLGRILADQIDLAGQTANSIDCEIEEGYRTQLY